MEILEVLETLRQQYKWCIDGAKAEPPKTRDKMRWFWIAFGSHMAALQLYPNWEEELILLWNKCKCQFPERY